MTPAPTRPADDTLRTIAGQNAVQSAVCPDPVLARGLLPL